MNLLSVSNVIVLVSVTTSSANVMGNLAPIRCSDRLCARDTSLEIKNNSLFLMMMARLNETIKVNCLIRLKKSAGKLYKEI